MKGSFIDRKEMKPLLENAYDFLFRCSFQSPVVKEWHGPAFKSEEAWLFVPERQWKPFPFFKKGNEKAARLFPPTFHPNYSLQ